MRRGWSRLLVVGWVATAAAVGVVPNVARADGPLQQGWWTVTNPGGLPVNPSTVNADVPADGLLVQAGPVNPTSPCGCTALAGLVFELSDGTTATDLTLKVAPNSGTTPVATLELCTLVNPTLDAEQGGALGDAPDYDCTHKATAALSSGGSSFTFHVASLVSAGILAVAVLPGDSTSRVVLSKPGNSSLATAASVPSSGFSPSPTPTSSSGAGSGSSSGGGSSVSQPSVPNLPQQPAVGGTDAGQAPVVAPSPVPSATALAVAPVAAATGAGNGSTPVAVLILLGGLVLAATLWSLAGRGPTEGIAES
jgi:hypothetical protein